jgi:glucosamine 6-phosphate synthetase-like amidotransferase/phosphosugar isomerase protein
VVAKYWIRIARITVEVDIALVIAHRQRAAARRCSSQSGETADTWPGYAKEKPKIIAIAGKAHRREADIVLPTLAGPESASPRPRRLPLSSRS